MIGDPRASALRLVCTFMSSETANHGDVPSNNCLSFGNSRAFFVLFCFVLFCFVFLHNLFLANFDKRPGKFPGVF